MSKAPRAFALTSEQEVVEQARITLLKLLDNPEFREMPNYIKRAKGILIFPELYKGGFVVGAEGGTGVLMVRGSDGSWSDPAFYTLASGSVGLQFGGQVSEVIFTVMNQQAVDAVIDNQMKFGANASLAVGPVGKGIGSATTTNFNEDVYYFAKTEGFFGGISFDGSAILKRDSYNEGYYGKGATPYGILVSRQYKNPKAQILKSLLAGY
jgi:lipid-binding SYLF domain-containing protein